MKTNKKFDCVKMMRDIRDKMSSEMKDMSPEQILDYIKNGRNAYEKIMANSKKN